MLENVYAYTIQKSYMTLIYKCCAEMPELKSSDKRERALEKKKQNEARIKRIRFSVLLA